MEVLANLQCLRMIMKADILCVLESKMPYDNSEVYLI